MIDLAPMEPYRETDVELKIAKSYRLHGMRGNVRAGDILCLPTGRIIRWSIAIEAQPLPEFFVSVQADDYRKATNAEAKFVLTQFRLNAVRELNANSENQSFIRCFHVTSKRVH